jgi:hypothetical protein
VTDDPPDDHEPGLGACVPKILAGKGFQDQ